MSTRAELAHATVLFSGCHEGDVGLTTGEPSAEVVGNRAALVELLGVRGIAVAHQVHGARVRTVASADGYAVAADDADGAATAARGIALGVHVADCLPVAIAGDGAVAMLHCGWRGLAGEIIAEGVRTLRSLGAIGPLQAAIGPGAGVCCYETGADVRAVFAAYGASDGARIDLAAIARAHLAAAGVACAFDAGVCTICAPSDRLFSYRRDGPRAGRQGGFAWLR